MKAQQWFLALRNFSRLTSLSFPRHFPDSHTDGDAVSGVSEARRHTLKSHFLYLRHVGFTTAHPSMDQEQAPSQFIPNGIVNVALWPTLWHDSRQSKCLTHFSSATYLLTVKKDISDWKKQRISLCATGYTSETEKSLCPPSIIIVPERLIETESEPCRFNPACSLNKKKKPSPCMCVNVWSRIFEYNPRLLNLLCCCCCFRWH